MAAAFMATNHRKQLKSTALPDTAENDLTTVPPEKEWEYNVELGMLMLNG
jgi:hypothetical protein